MKGFVATIIGFFSGLLIYFLAFFLVGNMVLAGSPSLHGLAYFVLLTFVGGWAVSTYIVLKGARSVSKVFSRGFLLGAAEWLCMIPAGLIFAGKTVSDTIARSGGSDAAAAGATIGGGIAAFISGGVSVMMAVVCLVGFAISYFMGREMKEEAIAPTRRCPECAELIQAAAKKCRYCGSTIAETTSNATSGNDKQLTDGQGRVEPKL